MKNLIIDKRITPSLNGGYSAIWFIVNPECKDLCFNVSEFSNLQEIEESETNIKLSILHSVNNYLNEEIYQLETAIIPSDFYDKTQEDGRKAVNQFMRELFINSRINGLPRNINKQIEITFKPVVEALAWGWWITAKEECEAIELNNIVNQDLFNRVYIPICNYINSKYPKNNF